MFQAVRLEAIAIRLEAIASRLEAIAIGLEAVAGLLGWRLIIAIRAGKSPPPSWSPKVSVHYRHRPVS